MFQFGVLSTALFWVGTVMAFSLVGWRLRWPRKLRVSVRNSPPDEFPERYVLHSDGIAHQNSSPRSNSAQRDTYRLEQRIRDHFENARDLIAADDFQGNQVVMSRDDTYQATRRIVGDRIHLEIDTRHRPEPAPNDVYSREADADELRMLRANVQSAPFLLWRQNANGDVVWANKSYLTEATKMYGLQHVSSWPIPSLFQSLEVSVSRKSDHITRVQSGTGDDAAWYDCHMVDVDGDTLCTAFRADEAVRSEARRQEFTQTLTKTFSDLAIGLAIFDRSRRLVLFNPAVMDLMSLTADFLISRPSLIGFLDQLRERRVMPEPRDYRSWRKSITDLEAAALDGTYSETWSLPDGQTFRVSGRPHPDGAFALLFEDISAELSLTRRFRAQLEESQSVIDALDDAVAVFSAGGELTFANAAYQKLWIGHPTPTIVGTSVVEATRAWHEKTIPTPVWGDFRDFASQSNERDEWTADVQMRDGRFLGCRFVPQKAGASLVIFQLQSASAEPPEELRQAV